MNVPTMRDDERPIRSVATQGEEYSYWRVGRAGVTLIMVYPENSQIGAVPWLAVYEGTHLARRVNAAALESIWYGDAPEAE